MYDICCYKLSKRRYNPPMQNKVCPQTPSSAMHSFLIAAIRFFPSHLSSTPFPKLRYCYDSTTPPLQLFSSPLLLPSFFLTNAPLLSPYRPPFQLNKQHRHSYYADKSDKSETPSSSHDINHDVDDSCSTSTDETANEVVCCCC